VTDSWSWSLLLRALYIPIQCLIAWRTELGHGHSGMSRATSIVIIWLQHPLSLPTAASVAPSGGMGMNHSAAFVVRGFVGDSFGVWVTSLLSAHRCPRFVAPIIEAHPPRTHYKELSSSSFLNGRRASSDAAKTTTPPERQRESN
jgi:hypothetical protein